MIVPPLLLRFSPLIEGDIDILPYYLLIVKCFRQTSRYVTEACYFSALRHMEIFRRSGEMIASPPAMAGTGRRAEQGAKGRKNVGGPFAPLA
jgi:hypothetical protein